MTRIFGGEKGLRIINRACKWAVATPERYAMLQCFAELDSTTMFSMVWVEDRLEAQIRQLKEASITYIKKQVQEYLGVTASQLNILVGKYGIDPFWRQSDRDEEKSHKLSLVLNEEEYQLYKTARDASGYRFDRYFIERCVLEYIKEKECRPT